MSVSNILFKSCLIIGTVTVLACCEEFRVGPLAAQAEDPKPFSPECLGGYFDCKGIPDGNAQDLGCGCDEPAPGPCGCEPCSDPVDCLGVPNGTAQDLGCGCGKPAPGECGCEACPVDCFGVTNGTAEDLGCGCGQPAPGKCGCKPCQECLWVAAWANFTDDPGRGMTKYSLEYLEKQFKYKGNKAVPGCFVKKWSGKRADCGIHRKDTKSGSKQRWGLCGVAADYTTPDDLGTFLGDPDMDEAVHKVSKDSDALETYTWYMDKNCHWTNLTPDKKICGFAGVSWSPISLIWDDGVSLEEGMTVASFSINAAEPESYSLWKASDKAPLLVYDPQKGGRVTSAKQLFGAYSFGGQTTRVTDYQADELRAPWTNGYEALALLDANRDNKISGSELDDLALWFDANRDGISQPGEVKSLATVQVTALYYKPTAVDTQNGDIRAALGYERLLQGKLVQGASVDWFAQTFATKQEAVVALSAIFAQAKKTIAAAQAPEKSAVAQLPPDWVDNPLRFAPHQAQSDSEDLSGYWRWTLNEAGGENRPGIFAFEQFDGTQLAGFSVVEAQLAPSESNLRSAVSALPVRGTVSRSADGKLQLSMKITDRQSGGEAQSIAVLSEDGSTLSGQTVQHLVTEADGKRRSATFRYAWTAQKFVFVAPAETPHRAKFLLNTTLGISDGKRLTAGG